MDATPDRTLFPWMSAAGANATMPFPGADAMTGLGKAWVQEVTSLLAARLRADADTMLAMGACTTMTDMALVQQRWLTEAGQAYAEASQRLMRVAMDSAAASMPAPQAGPTA